MKCLNCGFENTEGNNFCRNCGSKLEAPQMPKFCTDCGNEIIEGHLFCVGCGKRIQPVEEKEVSESDEIVHLNMVDDSVKENNVPNKKEKKKSPIIIVLIIIILLALIVAGALWIISSKNQDKKDEDSTQKTTTQTQEQEDVQETEDNIEETENYVEEIEVEETEVEETESEEVVLGILDYQTICMNLMETESAFGSNNEKMSVDMAQTIVSANIVSPGSSYCMKDIDTINQESLVYELSYSSARSLFGENGIYYNLHDYREELEGSEYDFTYVGSVYKKDEFMKLVEAFCPYTTHSAMVEFDDYFGVMLADGGPWFYFDAYDIKENENYIMVKAACYEGNNGGGENVYTYTVKVLFEKTPDSVLGMRAVYVEGYSENITQNIASITASSSLPDYNEKTYNPGNLVDGDYGTPWVENVEGVGVGETIQITLNNKMLVQELLLYNGYQSSEELFEKNGYVTKISVDFGDGIVKELDCTSSFYSGTDRDYVYFNKLSLDKPVYTDTIVITILDANAGSKYSDTCISEIELH